MLLQFWGGQAPRIQPTWAMACHSLLGNKSYPKDSDASQQWRQILKKTLTLGNTFNWLSPLLRGDESSRQHLRKDLRQLLRKSISC